MHIRPPHIRLLHPYQACVHGRVRARRRGARYAGMRVLRLHRAAPLQAVPVAPLCRCVRALVRVRGECVCILRLRVCMRTMNAHTAQSCCRAGAEHPHFSPPHRYYSTVRLVAQHLASCGFLCVSYPALLLYTRPGRRKVMFVGNVTRPQGTCTGEHVRERVREGGAPRGWV